MVRISEVHTDQRQAGLGHMRAFEPGLPLANMDTACSSFFSRPELWNGLAKVLQSGASAGEIKSDPAFGIQRVRFPVTRKDRFLTRPSAKLDRATQIRPE